LHASSRIFSKKGVPGRILKAWFENRVIWCIEELGRVLRYLKISRRHGWSDAQVLEFVEDVTGLAILVPGELRLAVVAEDPSDDRNVECAVEGNLVTL
jgi:hypothetical protein